MFKLLRFVFGGLEQLFYTFAALLGIVFVLFFVLFLAFPYCISGIRIYAERKIKNRQQRREFNKMQKQYIKYYTRMVENMFEVPNSKNKSILKKLNRGNQLNKN